MSLALTLRLHGFADARRVAFRSLGAARVLPVPLSLFVAGDGRALAWFGRRVPAVLHPTLGELARLHGLSLAASSGSDRDQRALAQ